MKLRSATVRLSPVRRTTITVASTRADGGPAYQYFGEGVLPLVNAPLPIGEWQILEISFVPPRFGAAGRTTAKSRFFELRSTVRRFTRTSDNGGQRRLLEVFHRKFRTDCWFCVAIMDLWRSAKLLSVDSLQWNRHLDRERGRDLALNRFARCINHDVGSH